MNFQSESVALVDFSCNFQKNTAENSNLLKKDVGISLIRNKRKNKKICPLSENNFLDTNIIKRFAWQRQDQKYTYMSIQTNNQMTFITL